MNHRVITHFRDIVSITRQVITKLRGTVIQNKNKTSVKNKDSNKTCIFFYFLHLFLLQNKLNAINKHANVTQYVQMICEQFLIPHPILK